MEIGIENSFAPKGSKVLQRGHFEKHRDKRPNVSRDGVRNHPAAT